MWKKEQMSEEEEKEKTNGLVGAQNRGRGEPA